jgi:hypothetical protein
MTTSRLDARAVLGLLAVATIWTAAWGAMQLAATAPGTGRSVIAVAAAIDASLTASLALYLIAVRKGRLPRWTVKVTVAAGLAFTRLVLGTTPDVARIAAAAASTIEIGLMVLLVWRGRRALRVWRAARAADATFVDALSDAFAAAGFPARLASVVATEVALLHAVAGGWRRPARSPAMFTVHRANGWPIYAGVIVFLTLVETAAVHIALAAYASPTAAWVVTIASLYTAVWILGDALALRHGGVVVGERGLELRIGVRWRGTVAWSNVEAIERGVAPAGALDVSILGGNIVLRLREPVTVRGLFGRRRAARVLSLSIDEPDGLLAAVAGRYGSGSDSAEKSGSGSS